MFCLKGVLKICSKFTGEHPYWSAILIKLLCLLCTFIEIALRHGCSPVNLLHIFKIPFPKNTSDLVTFTEEILNGNFHFLCSVHCSYYSNERLIFLNIISNIDRSILDQNDLKVMETLYFMVTAHQTIQTVSGKNPGKKPRSEVSGLELGLGLGSGFFFPGRDFFLELIHTTLLSRMQPWNS